MNGIVVSGGSSTKRHMLSPVHYKLLIIILCFGFVYQNIINFHHNFHREISMPKDTFYPHDFNRTNKKSAFNDVNSSKTSINGLDKTVKVISNSSLFDINQRKDSNGRNFSTYSINYDPKNITPLPESQ